MYVCAGSQGGAHVHDSYQMNLYISKKFEELGKI
jgi:beta-fructofuranosidase